MCPCIIREEKIEAHRHRQRDRQADRQAERDRERVLVVGFFLDPSARMTT